MPQMQFSTLVLPAPFGPMSASSSRASRAKEMPSSTRSPPKARRSSRSSSSAIPAAAAAILLDVAVAAARAGAAEIELRDAGPRAASPEINPRAVRVRAQPRGRAIEPHPAVLHHVAVVGALECHAGVLLD